MDKKRKTPSSSSSSNSSSSSSKHIIPQWKSKSPKKKLKLATPLNTYTSPFAFSDITITSSDKVAFHASKHILASRSPVLAAILNSDPEMKNIDMEYDSTIICKFMYLIMDLTGRKKINAQNIKSVHHICFKYEFLWYECKKLLCSIKKITIGLLIDISAMNTTDHKFIIDSLIKNNAIDEVIIKHEKWDLLGKTTRCKVIASLFKWEGIAKHWKGKLVKIKKCLKNDHFDFELREEIEKILE